jgi:hypothetical protein
MIKFFYMIGLALAATHVAIASAQSPVAGKSQVEQTQSTVPLSATAFETPRCAEIAALGPEYKPLANACEFAISRATLPNFICQETMSRSARGSTGEEWKPVDVVTATVTYVSGACDRYLNLTINGRPVDSLAGSGGWNSLALFGSQLTTIFLPATKTDFKLHGNGHEDQSSTAVFDFRFKRENNFTFKRGALRPGLSGSIFVDTATGSLQRVEAYASELDPNGNLTSYKSELEYGLTAIADLGNVLAPVAGSVEVCFTSGACDRNILIFQDCRKFGSESRIIPNPAP